MCNSVEQEDVRDVGRLINTVSHQLKRRVCLSEDEDSLTNMQRHVLHFILFQSMQNDIFQKDVEKEFEIRRSTATGTLQLLEKKGFITRKSVKRDARLKRILPTERAENIRDHIMDNIRYMENLLQKDIPDEQLDICIEVLEKMSANLSGDEKGINREETAEHE